MSGGERRLLGRWGEEQGAQFLRRHGFRVLAAGWQCRYGEIDLIAQKGGYLCFVEVKLRKDDRFAQAREFVDHHKQQRIRTSAQMYLAQYPTQLQPRFDVLEVYAPEGMDTQKPKIVLLEDAFE